MVLDCLIILQLCTLSLHQRDSEPCDYNLYVLTHLHTFGRPLCLEQVSSEELTHCSYIQLPTTLTVYEKLTTNVKFGPIDTWEKPHDVAKVLLLVLLSIHTLSNIPFGIPTVY